MVKKDSQDLGMNINTNNTFPGKQFSMPLPSIQIWFPKDSSPKNVNSRLSFLFEIQKKKVFWI